MYAQLAKLALAIGRESARQEFEWILKHGKNTINISDMLDRRIAGEPLQYILGSTPFGHLDILTRRPILIPRPETEHWALRLAATRHPSQSNPVRVLDLCTGTGCIPLLLCHLWPPHSTRALGLDISPDAIRLAADNTLRLHSQNTFTPLLADLRDPDLLRWLDPSLPFDVITANPPYIPISVYHTLPASVKEHEDPRALIGGVDGLDFYRAIAALLACKGLLAPRATIALEVGHDQAHPVTHILRTTPGLTLGQMEIWKDPWDKDRVIFARAL